MYRHLSGLSGILLFQSLCISEASFHAVWMSAAIRFLLDQTKVWVDQDHSVSHDPQMVTNELEVTPEVLYHFTYLVLTFNDYIVEISTVIDRFDH